MTFMPQTETKASSADFGKYRLLALLATGGMAEIFLARVKGLAGFEKLVVVKRILPHLARERRFVEMFFDEAKLVASLNHPNIVQIFDLGEVAGQYFMAMEYLFGESSASLIRACTKEGIPIPVEIAAGVILQAAKGLHHAHTSQDMAGKPLNIVHRDISPQNIFILYEGLVKVVDFGVAKAASRSIKTLDGTLKGKFAYMSPEQVTGTTDLDARSDVFSLGVVLWEMLAGRKLYKQEKEFDVMKAITEQDAPPINSINPNVPEELAEVVAKALVRDRNDRLQSAGELHDRLRDWLKTCGKEWDSVAISKFMHDRFAERIQKKQAFVEQVRARELEMESLLFSDLAKEIMSDSRHSIPHTTPTAGFFRGEKRVSRFLRMPRLLYALGGVLVLLTAIFLFWAAGKSPQDSRQVPSIAKGTGVETSPVGAPADLQPAVEKNETAEAVPISPAVDGGSPTVSQQPQGPEQPDNRLPAKKAGKKIAADRRPKGYLRLVTVPWTEVWYGKRRLGQTPLVDVELPAGKVRLKLLNPSAGIEKTVTVEIESGKRTAKKIELE